MCELGIRFYDKVLNKNKAIRELSGKDLYSVCGNEYPGLFQMRNLPLTTRKLYFQYRLAEHQAKAVEEAKNAEQNSTAENSKDEKSD